MATGLAIPVLKENRTFHHSIQEQFMKALRLFMILFIAGVTGLKAQQPLGPGSIVFLAMQTDAPDAFAFAAMQDIAANDTIYFTDNGWDGSAFFANEETMRWYSSQPVSRGTVVKVIDPRNTDPNALIIGPGNALGKLNNISVSGEQILAYRIANGGGYIHLAGISTRNWLTDCNTVGTGNTNSTCLPSALTNGVNAFAFSSNATDTDNIFLNIPTVSGTPQSILTQINGNALNWFGNNDTTTGGMSNWPNWQFNFSDPNTANLQFVGNSARTLIEGTGPQTISMSLSNPLAVATSVTLGITLNGGAAETDYTLNPQAVNFTFQLSFAAGQTSASFTIDLADDGLDETGEGMDISVVSASPELIYTNPTELQLQFSDLSSISSTIDFGSATYSVTEGSQVEVTLQINPAAAQPGNISLTVLAGSGVEGSDFSTNPAIAGGVLNLGINQGANSISFTFNASDDALVESDETVSFGIQTVSAGFSAGTNVPTAIVTLLDNDQPVELPVLFINEIMSSNTNTIEDQPGEYDDWFEIFNPGNEAVDIGGFYVTDDKNNPTKHQFPTGDSETIIPAGGFLLVWADEQIAQGALHANIKLSANGEFLGLYADDAAKTVIDSISFPAIQADNSYGRQTDGNSAFIIFPAGATTPGASNQTSGIGGPDKSKLNVFPNPANDYFTVGNLTIVADYRIYDFSGRLVQQGLINPGNAQIELNSLSKGTYNLVIIGKDGSRRLTSLMKQ
jgi:hypothetical protein